MGFIGGVVKKIGGAIGNIKSKVGGFLKDKVGGFLNKFSGGNSPPGESAPESPQVTDPGVSDQRGGGPPSMPPQVTDPGVSDQRGGGPPSMHPQVMEPERREYPGVASSVVSDPKIYPGGHSVKDCQAFL